MRGRAGYVGFNRTASTTYASGVWTVREAEALRRSGEWPRGPLAPTSLTATAGNAQISLSWTAPATTYGTITNYIVEYTPSGGSAAYVLTGSTSTSYTLTGLTNGTSYSVRVAAVNFTAGDWSGTAIRTPVALALSVSPSSLMTRQGTSITWSGSGTLASPLRTIGGEGGGSPFGDPAHGQNIDQDGWRTPAFVCGVSGTLYVTYKTMNDDGWDDAAFVSYKKNGTISTSFIGSQSRNDVTWVITRTLAVSAGDSIQLWEFYANSPRAPLALWIQ